MLRCGKEVVIPLMLSRIALFCAVVACASVAGWSTPVPVVSVTAFTTAPPFTATVVDASQLAVGMVAQNGTGATITAITGNVISLTSQAFASATQPLPATIAFVTPTSAQDASFQVRYASNLNIGDSVINISNSGANGGNICANVYTFSPDEQLISCCSCNVTPNALVSLSANDDLVSNTLTPAHPTSIVIKILGTLGTCNAASAASPASTIVPGLVAWGTTLHSTSAVAGGVFGTETPFTPATLSSGELTRITSFCGFIQANGSGFGICRSCRLGGLGAVAK